MYNYEVKIDEEGMRQYFTESTKVFEDRELTDQELLQLEMTLNKWREVTGEIWIGRKDYRLYRVELRGNFNSALGENTKFDLAVDLSEFNKKVEIEKPADVREFNMLEVLMPGMMNVSADDMDDFGEDNESDFDFELLEEELKGIDGVSEEELMKSLEELKAMNPDLNF